MPFIIQNYIININPNANKKATQRYFIPIMILVKNIALFSSINLPDKSIVYFIL